MREPSSPLDSKALTRRADDLAHALPDPLSLRLHRALSWLKRAEQEVDDEDVRFILLWISFNAAYAREVDSESATELKRLQIFFNALVKLDIGQRIRDAALDRFREGIHQLVDNRYVFMPFWKHSSGEEGYEDWKTRFAKEKRELGFNLENGKTVRVLLTVFRRLYVLRNQLLHGAATWRGRVNREQVEDGAAVLGWLVPLFLEIMINNPHHDWGEPSYPPLERPDDP